MQAVRLLLILIHIFVAHTVFGAAKTEQPILISGQLANGFHYSIYRSDDADTYDHKEDVSLRMVVNVGDNQQDLAERVGLQMGDAFNSNYNGTSKFTININDITDQKLNVALAEFYRISSGILMNDPKATAFVEKWYQPQFMNLAVAGKVDPAQVEAQIKQLFTGLKAGEAPTLYTPPKGVSYQPSAQNAVDELAILFPVVEDKKIPFSLGGSYANSVLGVHMRATMRIAADQQAALKNGDGYFTSYAGQMFYKISVSHNANAPFATKWLLRQIDSLRQEGIVKNTLSGFRMWLKAEGIDHFSPFKPDGKPSDIADELTFYEVPTIDLLLSSEEQLKQADEFLKSMDAGELDTFLKHILKQKIRIISVQNDPISTKTTAELKQILIDYNRNK